MPGESIEPLRRGFARYPRELFQFGLFGHEASLDVYQ